jgi:hypothetical protein
LALLNGGKFLQALFSKDPDTAILLRRVISGVNNLAKQLGANPIGNSDPPKPINNINVKGTLSGGTLTCPGELLHFTLDHNAEISKGIHYVSEIATDPNFSQPHVIDHGASRTHTMVLPTLLDDNATAQTYYLRSYPQYRGSKPQTPTVFGGLSGAIKIKMSGTTAATLLPSTGSGTAQNNGQQGGYGLGKTITRPDSSIPKRSVAVK